MDSIEHSENNFDFETRFLCKTYIGLVGNALREHLASTHRKKFTKEILDRKANLKLQSFDPKAHFAASKFSKQEKSCSPNINQSSFGSRRNLKYLTSHSVRNLMELRQAKSLTWVPTPTRKASPSAKKKQDNLMRESIFRQGLSEAGESLRLDREGSSQKEIEKQRAIARERERAKGSNKTAKPFRRKSCCCSDCGGISKFESKNEHIVVPFKRQAERLSNKSCLSLVHEQSQPFSLFRHDRDSDPLSFAKVSTPRLMNFSELSKQFSSEPKILMSDKLLNSQQMKFSKKNWGVAGSGPNIPTLEELEKTGNHKYRESAAMRSSFRPEFLRELEDELIEKPMVSRTKMLKDRRQKSLSYEPISLFVENIQERMKKLGLLGYGKDGKKKKIPQKSMNINSKNQTSIKKKISDIKEMSEGSDDSIRIVQEENKGNDLLTVVERSEKPNKKLTIATGVSSGQKAQGENTEGQEAKEGDYVESAKTRTSLYLSTPTTPKNRIIVTKKVVRSPIRINKKIREFKPLHLSTEGLVNMSSPLSARAVLQINVNTEKKEEVVVKTSSLAPYRAVIVCKTERNSLNTSKAQDQSKNSYLPKVNTDTSTRGLSTQRSEKRMSFVGQETPRGVSGSNSNKIKIEEGVVTLRKASDTTPNQKINKQKTLQEDIDN